MGGYFLVTQGLPKASSDPHNLDPASLQLKTKDNNYYYLFYLPSSSSDDGACLTTLWVRWLAW